MKHKAHSRKYWIFLFILSFLFLTLVEFGLRIGGVGEKYSLTKKIKIDGQAYHKINRNFPSKYFTKISDAPEFRDRVFPVKKDSSTFRIIALGGSSTFGFPYTYTINFPQMLEFMLNISYPQRKWEVISFATSAINSYSVVDIMKQIPRYKPDLVLIYAGHNEFYGAFGLGSVEKIPGGYYLTKISIWMKRNRTYQLMSKSIQILANMRDIPTGTLMNKVVEDKSIPFKSEKYLDTRRDYLRNLYGVASIAEKHNIPVIMSNLVSNLSDQPPFVSVFSDEDYNSKKLWIEFENYLSNNDSTQIDNFLKDLGIWESQSAIYHYCLGKYFESINDFEQAYEEYLIARDKDALRFRASSDFNMAIEKFSLEKQWYFTNLDSIFRKYSENYIPGNNLFLEHLHPNAKGTWLMARSFFETMSNKGMLPDWNPKYGTYEDFFKIYPITEFELISGNISIEKLRKSWPFQNETLPFSFVAQNKVEDIAWDYLQHKYNWGEANTKLVEYYENEGNISEAIRVLESVYLANPTDYKSVLKIISYYEKDKNFQKGIDYLQQLKQSNKHAILNFFSGIFYYNLGKISESQLEFELAYQYNESSVVLSEKQLSDLNYYYVSLLAITKQYKKAKVLVDSILIKTPTDTRIQYLQTKLESIEN